MPRKAAAKNNPPVRVPPKLGTMGPESGPSAATVVDANAPSPLVAPDTRSDPKAAKAQEKAQKTAENEKAERSVKVRVTHPKGGYIGNKHRPIDDVFVLTLEKGEKLPSWVVAEPSDDVATTPLSHSAEAQEEVVDSAGIGHTADSLAKEQVK